MGCDTPVVLLIYKRPHLTARALAAIAKARPRTLLVVADGPRPDRPGEAEACRAARAVVERVDWECDILRNYADENLGCGRRPASGLTWAFEHVDRAIVLEDDCIPLPGFFRFCDDLLARYRDDERVMHVGGTTLRRSPVRIRESYYFSRFNVAAGSWATWRRAWRHFDMSLAAWPELRRTSWLADLLQDRRAVEHWSPVFELACRRAGDVSYWDHQWTFACWANSGLSVLPRTNLATNVGGGLDATHMASESDPILNVPVAEMAFPLVHPERVLPRCDLDREFLREVILSRSFSPSPLRVAASRVFPEPVKRGLRQVRTAWRERRVQVSS